MQITDTVLMVRPVAFHKNEDTSASNDFQKELDLHPNTIQVQAREEFDVFVSKLNELGITVIVLQDALEPKTPDSIFPNNWISFHEGGLVAVYPMESENRRLERREDVLEEVEKYGYKINNIIDYTSAEDENVFLEGTGSMVLDRVNKKAYCALSTRSDEDLFIEFCEDFEYDPIVFSAFQIINSEKKPIYHTNVLLTIGTHFAVVCLEVIENKKEQKQILSQLKQSKKEVIVISKKQMDNFAGNMLELKGEKSNVLVMSSRAYESLDKNQLVKLEKYCYLLTVNLNTIETLGGGSARCMLAEVF